jgi:CheY-like chemotaxis protein
MPPERGTETILVVDDELAVLSLTEAMLSRYGYTPICAASAAEALHLLEVWPDLQVDMTIIDVVMKDMDGSELAERLRQLRPELPVLYISAYSQDKNLRPAFARALPLLSKPFSSLVLIGKIREMLDSHSSGSAGGK